MRAKPWSVMVVQPYFPSEADPAKMVPLTNLEGAAVVFQVPREEWDDWDADAAIEQAKREILGQTNGTPVNRQQRRAKQRADAKK